MIESTGQKQTLTERNDAAVAAAIENMLATIERKCDALGCYQTAESIHSARVTLALERGWQRQLT